MADGNPIKLCECGCGNPAPIAKKTNKAKGWVKGQPIRFIAKHHRLKHGYARGHKHSSLYACWVQMRIRCRNKNCKSWPGYGGRGIEVCERWDSYENFLADMGERPEGTSLDRIDNDGNYEPGNCCWATAKQQRNNVRTNLQITAFGRTQTLSAWAEESGIHRETIRQRLKANWSLEDALTLRPYSRKSK